MGAPVASAIEAPCAITGAWTSPITKDTWRFEKCIGTMSVVRSGGKLGDCQHIYPVGSIYRTPEDDCAYYVSGGPL